MTTIAAVDLGAQSGRVAVGTLDGDRLSVNEVHRFPNVPVEANGTLYWDPLRLFDEIQIGLAAAGSSSADVASVGIDSWGVDYGLLDGQGRLIENPVHHRDRRTDGATDALFAEVPAREIYERTGIQRMPINTLIQLYAAVRAGEASLEIADVLLLIPDLFHFWLSGVATSEYTNATTTQCLDPRAQAWATGLLERLRLPATLLPELVRPATPLGSLLPEVAARTRLRRAVVVAPATHDTASAVTAVPFRQRSSVYISAGTWSLVGMELDAPLITDEAFAANLTNEGGIDGTVRLLKNVNGMWLVHECQRAWADEGDVLSFEELVQLAEAARPLVSLMDPDEPLLMQPGSMPERIRQACAQVAEPEPVGPGAIVRCVVESLALKYRHTIELLSEVTGAVPAELHIVGGGARNALLCQATADATGLTVLAGPEEATVVGNLLGQAIALGELSSLEDARAVVRASFAPRVFEPSGRKQWEAAHERFAGILRGGTQAEDREVAAR
jgi:rhamnulokinase